MDHSLKQLLAQRVFSIACGYADANDSARESEGITKFRGYKCSPTIAILKARCQQHKRRENRENILTCAK